MCVINGQGAGQVRDESVSWTCPSFAWYQKLFRRCDFSHREPSARWHNKARTSYPELIKGGGMGMAGRCLKAEPDAINKHPSPPSRAGACPGGPGEPHPCTQSSPCSEGAQTWWTSCVRLALQQRQEVFIQQERGWEQGQCEPEGWGNRALMQCRNTAPTLAPWTPFLATSIYSCPSNDSLP